MQIQHFGAVAAQWPERTRVVRSDHFLASPATTIEQAAQLFGLDVSGHQAAGIAEGPVFSRHSKLAQLDYSVEQREADHEAASQAHREEIDLVVKWVEAVAGHCGVRLDPASS
jgi:hypothetical protein